MSDDELTSEQVTALTAAVDIDAPPPDGEPVALVLFGTNQAAPAQIAAGRYHLGAAPLVIATGGINRHNGIIEGREFARQLTEAGVPDDVIRVEDESKDTWQNVGLSLPYLHEALAMGLRLAVVTKWYHLRAVYCLATLLPEAAPFCAISWEPTYAGTLVTRANWPKIPDGRRRVVRESQEVPRRVADGTYRAATKADGAWRLSLCPRVPTRSAPHRAMHGGAPTYRRGPILLVTIEVIRRAPIGTPGPMFPNAQLRTDPGTPVARPGMITLSPTTTSRS